MAMALPSVLFVCCGNTCRSVMAEYLARHQYADRIQAESVGIRPGSLADTENAVYTLSQFKIDASQHRPRHINTVDPREFDVVVAIDKDIAGFIESGLDKSKLVIWNINDPYGNDLEEYRQCATAIAKNLRQLVDSLETGKYA